MHHVLEKQQTKMKYMMGESQNTQIVIHLQPQVWGALRKCWLVCFESISPAPVWW